MARLYGEIDADEAREFDAHVAADPAARREWEELSATRDLLGRAAEPVPAPASRVWVVDRPLRRAGLGFGFAGGLAAAAALFTLGVLVGWRALPAGGGPATTATTATSVAAEDGATLPAGGLTAAQLETALRGLGLEPAALRDAVEARGDLARRQDALEAKLDGSGATSDGAPDALRLTRAEFEEGLARMMNRLDYQRQQDLEYVLSELTRVEQRQDSRIETNQAALRYALQSMPGVTER